MVCIIVMGVSGCGKSSVGQGLAERLALPFIEGDALHPEANIAKMAKGVPLEDADRMPWLQAIGERIALAAGRQEGAIVACSALKRSYRDMLREAAGPGLIFVHVTGERALLAERMRHRPGHFMPAALLDSQLKTLEPPEGEPGVVTVDCAEPLERIVLQAEKFVRNQATSSRSRSPSR